ncbi:MAG: hypothetical protein AAGF07_00585 [Patescibacteria group bacterium]
MTLDGRYKNNFRQNKYEIQKDNSLELKKIPLTLVAILSATAAASFLYESPLPLTINKPRTKLDTIKIANQKSDCKVEEIVERGYNPFMHPSSYISNSGHSFLAVTSADKETKTYGYYPQEFNPSNTDSVVVDAQKDLRLYSDQVKDPNTVSRRIYIDCQDLPKLEHFLRQAIANMSSYKFNPNFPFSYDLRSRREERSEVEGNCVTFLKEFFGSFRFVDDNGKEINHDLPYYDIPLAYFNLLKSIESVEGKGANPRHKGSIKLILDKFIEIMQVSTTVL